jgi:hypothetical protein
MGSKHPDDERGVGGQLPKHAELFPGEALTLLTQPLRGQLAMVTLARRIGIADTGARTSSRSSGPVAWERPRRHRGLEAGVSPGARA